MDLSPVYARKSWEEFSSVISDISQRDCDRAVSVAVYQVHQKHNRLFGGSTNRCKIFKQAESSSDWSYLNLFGFVALDLWRRAVHEGVVKTLWLKLNLARPLTKGYTEYRSQENPTRPIHESPSNLVAWFFPLLVSGHLADRLEVHQVAKNAAFPAIAILCDSQTLSYSRELHSSERVAA